MHFFILSAVNNYCVSSSARAFIVSNWCVRITKCCRKDILLLFWNMITH